MIDDVLNSPEMQEFKEGVLGLVDEGLQMMDATTYLCKDTGVVFHLKKISLLTLRSIQNNMWGMPQPPVVEVAVGPKKIKRRESNPNDPAYKEKLQEWTNAKSERSLEYICTEGVKDNPPQKDVVRLRGYLPGATESQIKYAWIVEQFTNPDEIGELSDKIVSMVAPSEKGISDAESTFPGNN